MAASGSRDDSRAALWRRASRGRPQVEAQELFQLSGRGRFASDNLSTEGLLPQTEHFEPGHPCRLESPKLNDVPLHDVRPRSSTRWRPKSRLRPASSLTELYADVKFIVREGRTIMLWRERDVALFKAMCDRVEEDEDIDLLTLAEQFADYENSDAVAKFVTGSARYDYIFSHPAPPENFTVVSHPQADDPCSLSEGDYRRLEERANFEQHLLDIGFFIEREADVDGQNWYIKIVAPFHLLAREAERIRLRLPLKAELPGDTIPQHHPIVSFFVSVFGHKLNSRKDTGFLRLERLHDFVDGDPSDPISRSYPCSPPVPRLGGVADQSSAEPRGESYVRLNFFSTGRRSLLVHSMLLNAEPSGHKVGGKATIHRLSASDSKVRAYNQIFILHDGSYKSTQKNPNMRTWLYQNWVLAWKSPQPLNEIRAYYGEKVALYFAWLGYYTCWLSVAALVGVIVFLYGVFVAFRPSAAGTTFSKLSNFQQMFDNHLSAPFAFFMSIWATLFLEFWKRKNAYLAYEWAVHDFEETEPTRPEWYGTTVRTSPITGKRELVYPRWERLWKVAASVVVVIISISVVLLVVGLLIIFKPRLTESLNSTTKNPMAANIGTALLSLVAIMVASKLYDKVARRLNMWENHRTQTEFEDALIAKHYVFDFVNYYSTLFYIAFIKRFYRADVAQEGLESSFLSELMVQLAIIFVGKQAINQLQEVMIPYLQTKWQKTSARKAKKKLDDQYKMRNKKLLKAPQWAKDEKLVRFEGVFNEFNEMVIQFGFITLFVSAFPLAPLFALLNNITEIRSDAYKLETQLQRPISDRAEDIGMWEKILGIVSLIAVPTNAFIIAFCSTSTDALLAEIFEPRQGKASLGTKLAFVVVFEHAVFVVKLVLAYLVPNVPMDVKLALERDAYLARLAMGEIDADDIPDEVLENPELVDTSKA